MWISTICMHPLQNIISLSTLPKSLFTKAVLNMACIQTEAYKQTWTFVACDHLRKVDSFSSLRSLFWRSHFKMESVVPAIS